MISKRLSAKIILAVLVVYIGVTLAISSYQLAQSYTKSRNDVLETLKSAGSSLGSSIALAVYNYDTESMQETLLGLVQFPEIMGVNVVNDNSKENVGKMGLTPSEDNKSVEFTNNEGAIDTEGYVKENKLPKVANLIPMTMQVQFADDPDADKLNLTLYTTNSFIQKRIDDAINTLIINTSTQILTLAVIMVILLKILVSQPLSKLEEAAIKISPDNEDHSFETDIIQKSDLLKRRDELGSLASTMESMRVAISRRDKEIRDYSENLELKVEERTKELQTKNSEITTLIDNMPVGIMTIEEAHVIGANYSPELLKIFDFTDRAINEASFVAFLEKISSLTSDSRAQILSALDVTVGSDGLSYEVNEHVFPTIGEIEVKSDKSKHLEFSWAPIVDSEEIVNKMLLCVRDVSLVKELESASREKQEKMDLIAQILEIGVEKYEEQLQGISGLYESTTKTFESWGPTLERKPSKDDKNVELFRYLHTLKGNARAMGCQKLASGVHEMETLLLESLPEGNLEVNQFGQMRQAMTQGLTQVEDTFQSISRSLKKTESDTLSPEGCYTLLEHSKQLQARSETNNVVLMEALRNAIKPHYPLTSDLLSTSVEQTRKNCEEIGKGHLQVMFKPKHSFLPRSYQSLLRDVFNHLLTNSITHGIPASSDPHYKEPEIHIETKWEDEKIHISLRDNGKGLNLKALREKAVGLKLPNADQMAPLELAELIFQSGMSTAQKVTSLAGRGVGMDAVKAFLEDSGGRIEIKGAEDQKIPDFFAFSFELTLPIPKVATSPMPMAS